MGKKATNSLPSGKRMMPIFYMYFIFEQCCYCWLLSVSGRCYQTRKSTAHTQPKLYLTYGDCDALACMATERDALERMKVRRQMRGCAMAVRYKGSIWSSLHDKEYKSGSVCRCNRGSPPGIVSCSLTGKRERPAGPLTAIERSCSYCPSCLYGLCDRLQRLANVRLTV